MKDEKYQSKIKKVKHKSQKIYKYGERYKNI